MSAQIIGIIGECSKDFIMLDYLSAKHNEILLLHPHRDYQQLYHYSEIDLLVISSEINLEQLSEIYATDEQFRNIIQCAQAKKLPIINNIELLYMYHKPKTIAITGSYSTHLLTHMIAHVLSRLEIDHYMSISDIFKWPENIDKLELLVISLKNHQLKNFDVFYATVGIVTNITEDKLDHQHMKQYLENTKHFLSLSQHQIIHINSRSADLCKYFPNATQLNTKKIKAREDIFKKQLAVFTSHAITILLQDTELFNDIMFECMRNFTTHGCMQTIFRNAALTIIDNIRAETIEQILYSINLINEEEKIILLSSEPENDIAWEKLKEKKYMSKIHSIVLFDVIESKLFERFQHAARISNAISFEQACMQVVKKFNTSHSKHLVIMLVGGKHHLSKYFQKAMIEYTTEDIYDDDISEEY